MSASFSDRQLCRSDYLLLGLFSLTLFGFSLIGGRVLTMHESRLPQAAREMFADGDWLIPKCGGRPWLERPPLPHWITVGIASIFGRCDRVWIVRIPPVLMGTLSVLLLAWMATGWFGRGIGILSGLMLATSFEFTRYAWLAEEDIFLAAIVLVTLALFAYLEFFRAPRSAIEKDRFFGRRPWPVFAFFVLLGATNLVKGLMFGAAMVLIPAVGFLLWNADFKRIPRYLWIWGWAACALAAGAWIAAASMEYPDLLKIWFRDVTNRTDGVHRHAPFWYYWAAMLWEILPWTGPAIYGLWLTRDKAFHERSSAERFLWCWALLPLAVFSLPAHKHHHYLVPCLAPWAILSALGSKRIWEEVARLPLWLHQPARVALGLGLPSAAAVIVCGGRLGGPVWLIPVLAVGIPAALFAVAWAIEQRNPRIATGTLFSVLAVSYMVGYAYSGRYIDVYREDSRFLDEVQRTVPSDQPLFVNSEGANLNMFRHMFYLGDNAKLIHNLTFLRDDRISQSEVYVIARQKDSAQLEKLGSIATVLEGRTFWRSTREMSWTLFRLRFKPDLVRYSSRGVTYTASQVMERQPGPFLGKRL